jgi:hypothetical protein
MVAAFVDDPLALRGMEAPKNGRSNKESEEIQPKWLLPEKKPSTRPPGEGRTLREKKDSHEDEPRTR